ncbi:ABC transporter permease subunit [Metabacillus sp. GX 13764]|uniref:ABC transporter permease n=1 Tax=Metabacillus kandeliae TaxID=2900151 RepID=UPI001E4FD1F4|nr:ABC transporter permease subunit [Metabacillus kandeliae]MCD7032652.1 ABC transporter permease subunit [Metabacillus kandeliae]
MKLFKSNRPLLLLLPAALLTLIFAGAGLFSSFRESLYSDGSYGMSAYQKIAAEKAYWASLFFSFRMAFFSSLAAILGGLVITRAIFPFLKKPERRLFIWLPLVFPHFVWGYMLLLLFGESGFFSSLLHQLGLISSREEFPALIRDEYGIGIFLTYVSKEIPFVILMLLPVYLSLGSRQRELVTVMGGSRYDAFKSVEWPAVYPVLAETFFILFAFILTAYEVPALLGAPYPKFISVLAYEWFNDGDWAKRPEAYAALISLSILLLLLVFLFYRTAKKRPFLKGLASGGESYFRKGSKLVFGLVLAGSLLPAVYLLLYSVLPLKWESFITGDLDLHGFSLLFGDPLIVKAILSSAGIAAAVIAINLLIGIPAAKYLAQETYKHKAVFEAILLSPLLLPAIMLAMGLQILFIKTGLANNFYGVIIIQLLPTLPYTVKIFLTGFVQTGKQLESQAKVLGASNWQAFKTVYLPLLLPSFRGAVFLISVISLGQYLLTAIIGGGNVVTLAMVYFPYFQQADDRLLASFSIVFAILPLLLWWIFECLLAAFLPYRKRR